MRRKVLFPDVADVGAVGLRSQRDIDAIVDDEWHVCFATQDVQVAGQIKQLQGCRRFRTKLDGGNATADRGGYDG